MLWDGVNPSLRSFGVKHPSNCWWHRGGDPGVETPLGAPGFATCSKAGAEGCRMVPLSQRMVLGAHPALGTRGGTEKQDRGGMGVCCHSGVTPGLASQLGTSENWFWFFFQKEKKK